MTTEVQTTDPETVFRAKAADCFHAAADMTLHQLCDEYVRLTEIIEAGTIQSVRDDFDGPEYTDEAIVARQERNIINGAARARFGLGFNDYESF